MYRLSLILIFFLGYNLIFSQSPHGDELKIDCAQCHTADSWLVNYNEVQFDHDTTIFKLEGAHDQTNCTECHSSLVFNEAPVDCASCHLDIHSMTVGNDCARCHTSETWLVDNIPELHEQNGFPLIGAHSTLSCIDCHLSDTNLEYRSLGNECVNCHKLDYLNTQSPNHQAVGFSTECIDCHSPLGIGWETEFIDHDFFPLTLGHDIEDCNACHLSSDFSDISAECVSCHQNDYNESTNPNHQSLNLSLDCVVCHTTDPDWMPARFDIHDEYYPLNGAHAKISDDCAICHNGDYNNTPNTCVGCHQDDYDDTTNPNHVQAQFSTDCMECHNENDWIPATFDHDSQYFPIYSGEHEGEWDSCTDCHTNPNNFADYTCTSCHTNPETNDDHKGISGYVYEDSACFACHPTGDAGEGFDHNSTGFPLTGGHIDIDCTQCHITNNYSDASPDCVTCHQNDYDNTQNPNHISTGYSTDCVSCHTTNLGWTPANVNHDFFPLTLGHDIQDCNQCHTTGNYSDASPDCVTCHQNDYDNTQNPNHTSTGFSTDCVSCHTTNPNWTPTNWDHNNIYPLNGAHAIIADDCAACHNGDYTNTPNTCVGCHQDDYNNTTNPNHIGAQFPVDCMVCHTESAWVPSTFDHDGQYFPVYNGAHAGSWATCAECHTNPNNYGIFTCLTCHTSAQTNNDHSEVSGYIYESNACFQCHPDGKS